MRHDFHQKRKKKPKKAFGLKILQSIIYLKEYFYMLYSTLKDMQALNKINHQANLKYDYSLKRYFRGKFFVQC